MRKCVGCQEMKSKKEMIRVIRTSEGEFLLDATGRKNGRGAYLCHLSNRGNAIDVALQSQ